MEPTQELIDALYREEIAAARAMAPGDRLIAGPRLFDQVCRRMADGIRDEMPDADESRVQEVLLHRLRVARMLESSPMEGF
jgi:hypothetical protein